MNYPLKTMFVFKETSMYGLLSEIEHASIDEALLDDGWIGSNKVSPLKYLEMTMITHKQIMTNHLL